MNREAKLWIAEAVVLMPLALWKSYVVAMLWLWFVVPLGVIQIGVWHALGLMLLGRYVTVPLEKVPERSWEEKSELFKFRLIAGAAFPAVVLGLGWVVREAAFR